MPEGLIGTFVLKLMNGLAHKDLAEWTFQFLDVNGVDSVLDIGCGGGGNIARLLDKYPTSRVDGVDFSATSVSLSKKTNLNEIANGRCNIYEGNVEKLPFNASSYEIVTAFETVYYWSDIERAFKEVFRVLKLNGVLLIGNGADAEGGWTWDSYIEGMHTYTPTELKEIIVNAGFKNVSIIRKENNHFFCIIAFKSNERKK